MRLGVSGEGALIKSCDQSRDGSRFGETAEVVTTKCNGTPRTDECLFGSSEIGCSAGNRGKPWKGNCPRRQVASASSHFKPEAVGDFFVAGFVDLDQYVLVRLIRNWVSRLDARPIEHSQIL